MDSLLCHGNSFFAWLEPPSIPSTSFSALQDESAHAEGGVKRSREESTVAKHADDSSDDDSSDDDVGPMPPPPSATVSGQRAPKKARKELQHRQAYLDLLPSAELYEKSYMHRDTVTHICAARATDFITTGSADGHVKFWRKMPKVRMRAAHA